MANVHRKGLIVIDTVGSASVAQAVISKIRWVGATTAGHTATVTDTAGNVFWASQASGANYVESDDYAQRDQSKRTLTGIVASALTSGTLYIYTE